MWILHPQSPSLCDGFPSSAPITLSLNERWMEKRTRRCRFEWLTPWCLMEKMGCTSHSDLKRLYLFMSSSKCIVSPKLPYKSFKIVSHRRRIHQVRLTWLYPKNLNELSSASCVWRLGKKLFWDTSMVSSNLNCYLNRVKYKNDIYSSVVFHFFVQGMFCLFSCLLETFIYSLCCIDLTTHLMQ